MKIVALFVMLICVTIGRKVAADPMAVSWDVKNENNTCFLATMGIEYNTMYNSLDNKTHSAMILFENATQFKIMACNDTMVQFTLMNMTADANLTLSYTLDDKNFMLSSVMIIYIVNNETFPNATNLNSTVSKFNNAAWFMTSLGMAYNCSLEADLRLAGEKADQMSADSDMDAYLRFTPDMKKGLMMQAFKSAADNASFGKVEQCFADHKPMSPELGKWQVMNKDKHVCAMMYSMAAFEVNYTTIAGQKMKSHISLTRDTMVSNTSVCGANSTNITLSIEGDVGNLTFGFVKTMKKYFYFADEDMFSLDFVELAYNPKAKYFPNHESESTVTMKQDKLDMLSAPVGSSFQCDVPIMIMNNDSSLSIMLNATHIQPFNVVDATFGNVSYCGAEPTTKPPQTTAPVKPDVDNPIVSDRLIVSTSDNKTNCLHACIGLQLMTHYVDKKSGNKTYILFNFDKNNCTTTAMCESNSTEFEVHFDRKEYNLNLTLNFTRDTKSSTTYLSGVMVAYDFSANYPNANDTSGDYTLKDLTHFKTSVNQSYMCSTETDILLNATEMIILRITGVQLEPLPKSNKFAKASKCFSDLDIPKPASGSWFVNETDDKKAICAHFSFTASVNVTYDKLVETSDLHYVVIPISNMTVPSGMCEPNKTTLMIPMDDNKINFTFVFEKNMTSKTEFTFSMSEFMMEYLTNSKYFPNHAYVSNGKVMLSNSSLKLFKSDQDHSYLCNQEIHSTFGGASNVLTMNNVQVQPFNVSKTDGTFSSADDCEADQLSDLLQLIILIAIILVSLALVVGVGCFAYRKCKRGKGYQKFPN